MAHTAKPVRVTILERNVDGTLSVKSSTPSSQKKKSTKGLGLIEKIVRTGAEAGTVAAGSYLARHKKSNEEEKDGWIKDAPVNVVRSGLKGLKKVKVSRFL
jgi:hypothetical protein